MTGPEHYLNAESDLEHAAHASDKGREDDVRYWLECAQVHAALAVAAATALNDAQGGIGARDWHEWNRAASANPPAEWPVTP